MRNLKEKIWIAVGFPQDRNLSYLTRFKVSYHVCNASRVQVWEQVCKVVLEDEQS